MDEKQEDLELHEEEAEGVIGGKADSKHTTKHKATEHLESEPHGNIHQVERDE